MSALEWNGKIEPKIRPDMTAKQVREQLKQAEGNGRVVTSSRRCGQLIGTAWPGGCRCIAATRPHDQDGRACAKLRTDGTSRR